MRHYVLAGLSQTETRSHCTSRAWSRGGDAGVACDRTFAQLYKPASHRFDSNNSDFVPRFVEMATYTEDRLRKRGTPAGNAARISVAQMSRWTSARLGLELLLAHEESVAAARGAAARPRYDAVVLWRPDVLLWKDMVLASPRYDLGAALYNNGGEKGGGDLHLVLAHRNVAALAKMTELHNELNFGVGHSLFGSICSVHQENIRPLPSVTNVTWAVCSRTHT